MGAPRSGRWQHPASLLVLLGLISAMACVEPLLGQDVLVPVADQWRFFEKVLNYDREHESRRAGDLVIGIAFQSGFRPSLLTLAEAEKVVRASLGEAEGVRIVRVELSPDVDLRGALERRGVEILYVAPLRSANLSSVCEATRSLGVLTVTGVEEYVHDCLALGIVPHNGFARPLINLPAARAEGADFSADLLEISRVLRW